MVGKGWNRGVGTGRTLVEKLKVKRVKIYLVYKRLGKLDEIKRTN